MKKQIIALSIIFPLIFSSCYETSKPKTPKDTESNPSKATSTINKKSTMNNFNTEEKDWYVVHRKGASAPEVDGNVVNLLKKYSSYYIGDNSKKELFLTFDEGYENGYSGKILDILKANNVKAAFFVTTPYIKTNKDLIKRMADEGHLVCNHSTTHPSMAKIANKDTFKSELSVASDTFKEATGKEMPKFFRPPMGKYSERSLAYTKELGYKTIFWSFAYADWDKQKQPSHAYAKKVISERVHNGSILLLHAVSKTNTEILDEVIKDLKKEGYAFKTLNDLK